MPRVFLPTLIAISIVLAGCTGTRLLNAPPEEQAPRAIIPGYDGPIRFADAIPEDELTAQLTLFRSQIAARVATEGQLPNGGVADVLVLSGGGSDGAYGAGLLNGWSDRPAQDRPEFLLVTGISTGALIAPYAFVGSEFDPELERFYTNTATDDILDINPLRALTGAALGLADTTRLVSTLDRALTPELIERIAVEHKKGRRLLVGTTNLDSQQAVTWDVGAIAVSDNPGKIKLIRDVLLASASIPGAFPPILFEVEADGKRYSEMHVDGGVTRQLFALPLSIAEATSQDGVANGLKRGTIYVVRNTKLAPSYEPTAPGLVPIASRSVSTLIKSAGAADIVVVQNTASRAGFGLWTSAVPESFDADENELFDPVYMRALYKVGYQLALEGEPWVKVLNSLD